MPAHTGIQVYCAPDIYEHLPLDGNRQQHSAPARLAIARCRFPWVYFAYG